MSALNLAPQSNCSYLPLDAHPVYHWLCPFQGIAPRELPLTVKFSTTVAPAIKSLVVLQLAIVHGRKFTA